MPARCPSGLHTHLIGKPTHAGFRVNQISHVIPTGPRVGRLADVTSALLGGVERPFDQQDAETGMTPKNEKKKIVHKEYDRSQ